MGIWCSFVDCVCWVLEVYNVHLYCPFGYVYHCFAPCQFFSNQLLYVCVLVKRSQSDQAITQVEEMRR